MKHYLTLKTLFSVCIVIIVIWAIYPYLSMPSVPMTIGDKVFTLDVAKYEATRTRGLSGREGLLLDTGMLFVFDTANYHSFWMRGMLFPIDIAWLDDGWCIVHMVSNVSPETYPETFAPSRPARYVIELNAGIFDAQKARVGTCFEAPRI